MRSEKVVSVSDGVLPIRTQPAECEKHGQFDQKVTVILGRELKGGCPECMRAIAEEREASDKVSKSYELRLSLTRKLGDALIPKRFLSSTLDNYQVEHDKQYQALKFCRHYVATFDQIREKGRCMVLIGKPGTGKTHLGAAIANELLHKTSRTAVYRTVGTVLQAIKATFDRKSELSESDILSSLINPDLLVLDEIGVSKEQPSDFELTTLFAIINGRYRGPNCNYTGRLMFDDDDVPTDDPSKDICKGCLSSCKLRFGENEQLPHGGFPAVSLIARS